MLSVVIKGISSEVESFRSTDVEDLCIHERSFDWCLQ